MRFLYFFLACCLSSPALFAQIQLSPLSSNPALEQQMRSAATKTATTPSPSAAGSQQQALTLPFFDDFSYPGPYPDPNLWIDSNVYVNQHLPYRPVSIGVATFDGLDKNGAAYGSGFGPADYLTSQPIDLSDFSEADDVNLSFYIQPKGISNFFPGRNDTLVLQFLNIDTVWTSIDTFQGLLNSTSPLDTILFRDSLFYPIDSAFFLHSDFQFRFVNHCNRIGMQFLWHLDDVYLDNKKADEFIVDLAFVDPLSSMLRTYRHMPWKHFKNSTELREGIDFGFFNHHTDTITATDDQLVIKDLGNDATVVSTQLFGGGTVETSILARQYKFFTNRSVNLSSVNNHSPSNPQDFILDMIYSFEPNLNEPSGIPALRANNEIHTPTIFSNFFAYDDGTPEGIISTRNAGTRIAQQFRTTELDTLRGVQFQFPSTGTVLNGEFQIKIWIGPLSEEINGEIVDAEPVYVSDDLDAILASAFFDTLNGFTTYPLVDENLNPVGIPLPVGDFYVGIEHVSDPNTWIGIGYDQNSPQAGPFQWFKNPGLDQRWQRIFQPGALMLRPLMGSETPIMTDVEEVKPMGLKLFPNPTADILHISIDDSFGEALEMMVFDATGKMLLYQPWQSELSTEQWPNGLYILQINNLQTGQGTKEKFLILR